MQLKSLLKKLGSFFGFFCAVVIITRLALQFGNLVNLTTVGFSFLVLVVLSAVFAGLATAIATSVVATLFFNYFFFDPVGTFTIAAFHNWVAVITFLFTAIVISRLTASAHQNARKSEALDLTLTNLSVFSGRVVQVPNELLSLSGIAEAAVEIFSLEYCSIHVYTEGKWHHFSGTAVGQTSREVAELLMSKTDHPTDLMELVEEQSLGVRYSRIRTGSESIALVAVKSHYLSMKAIDAMASIIGILLRESLKDTDVPLRAGR